MTQGFIDRLFAMAKEAKENGDHEMSQNLLFSIVTTISPGTVEHEAFDRGDIAVMVKGISEFAMRTGHKYAAYNLAFVALAILAGEKYEVLVGFEMLKHVDALKTFAAQSDILWPEILDSNL